jgi:lipopolysaccharide/colanic/teichoic acid biosynthesis glycosyltransferase
MSYPRNKRALRGSTKGGSISGFGRPATVRVFDPASPLSGFPGSGLLDGRVQPSLASAQLARPVPVWKRSMDIGFVLLTMPLWLPVMILIGLWIKATSSGPVFFRQTRIGLRTQPFTMMKFRSMKAGVDTKSHEEHFRSLVQNGGSMVKLDMFRDDRLIPGGRFLRMTGLDELPQIFNVLRGKMSLVGPRPCTVKELDLYSGAQKARFDVLPGITGYWQVSGKNKTTFNQMVEMDIQYGKRMSVVFDLVIVAGTFPALAMQALEARWHLNSGAPGANGSNTARTF